MTKPKTENIMALLTVAGLIAGGGVAWGNLNSKQDALDDRLAAVEQTPLDIAAMRATQEAMKDDIREIKKDQRSILNAVAGGRDHR